MVHFMDLPVRKSLLKWIPLLNLLKYKNLSIHPVKRYSSGMFVRLAFAVAAHLEPEILIIDEVLAVGDADFQKRCISKMGEINKTGKTILIVSHNMATIGSFCDRCILIDQGKIIHDGSVEKGISQYLSMGRVNSQHGFWRTT